MPSKPTTKFNIFHKVFHMPCEIFCMPSEIFAGQLSLSLGCKIFHCGPAKFSLANVLQFLLSWANFLNILKHSWLVATTLATGTTANSTGQQHKSTGPLWYHNRRIMKFCHFISLAPLWYHKIASVRKPH